MSQKVVLTCPKCGKKAPFDVDEVIEEYMNQIDKLLEELDELEGEVRAET